MSSPSANSVGALEIGVLISTLLFGVTTTQTYTYYNRFPKDPRALKAFVAFIWVFEVVHLVCIIQALYQFTVLTSPNALSSVSVSTLISFVVSGVTDACVQCFFGYRIYKLSNRLYIPIVVWIFAVLHMIFNLLPLARSKPATLLAVLVSQESWAAYSILVFSAADDIIIAATMVYYLSKERRTSQVTRSVAVVNKLIMWTIETCVLTSTAAITTLVLFAVTPEALSWLAVQFILARLFSNSLLASLNSRTVLRTRLNGEDNSSPLVHLSTSIEISKPQTSISIEGSPRFGDSCVKAPPPEHVESTYGGTRHEAKSAG